MTLQDILSPKLGQALRPNIGPWSKSPFSTELSQGNEVTLPAACQIDKSRAASRRASIDAVWLAIVIACTGYAAWRVYQYLSASLALSDVLSVSRVSGSLRWRASSC